MKDRTATHATFTIERIYPASPARVFAAWSNPEAKARWFVGPAGWTQVERTQDFRVGGHERVHGAFPNGKTSLFTARYHDIVPEERIIYAYDMEVNKQKISVSLATIEFVPEGEGTRMIFTEQGAFFDDVFPDGAASREQGTGVLLDQLGASLK